MSADDRDELLQALAGLPAEEPDAARSRAILASARRALRPGAGVRQTRLVLAGGFYPKALTPVAAGALSAAFIVSAIVQATAVLLRSGAHVFLAP